MTIEDGVAILFHLRRMGMEVRRSPSGNVRISPPGRLTDGMRETIRRNKEVVLEALKNESAPGIGKAERKARELLTTCDKPWVAVAETEGEFTYVAFLRRDESGATIRIPREKYDPLRLAEALMRVDPGGAVH